MNAKHLITTSVFFIALCLLYPAAYAQTGNKAVTDSNAPLEISADNTLEWHRNQQQYIARGNAMVKQGNVTIKADTLTADYKETKSSSFDIYHLSASGNVIITSDGNSAQGDNATYDVYKGVAVIIGNNLKMVSQNETVTAQKKFEYHTAKKELIATGNVHVIHGENTIDADLIKAVFKENNDGTSSLQRLEAHGNVKITTPTETIYSKDSLYKADTNIAELTGDVRILHGDNVLSGERAEVNLNTNISRMFGGLKNNGRVKGTFYPKSKNAKQDNQISY